MFRDFLPPRDYAHNNSPRQSHGSPLATGALQSDTLLSTSTNGFRTRLPLIEFILLRPLYVTDLSRAAPCIPASCGRDHTTSKLRIVFLIPRPSNPGLELVPVHLSFRSHHGFTSSTSDTGQNIRLSCRTSRHWSHNPSVVS